MSVRTFRAEPSASIELEDGVYPVVTQEDLAKVMLDAAVMLDRAGGYVFVALQRVPTGFPNEYVSTAAMVTWQDRTDAKPQPETDARTTAAPPAPVQSAPPAEVQEAPRPPLAAVDEVGDGLAVDPLAVDEADPSLQGVVGG